MSRNSGKNVGSYGSIIRGVSQQPAHLRFEGQHWEQINVNSDPVRGLATRSGLFNNQTTTLNGLEAFDDAIVMERCKFRSFKFTVGTKEYLLMYRVEASALPSSSGTMFKPYSCYNLTEAKWVLVKDDYDFGTGDSFTLDWYFGGFNTFCQMGDLLIGATRWTGGYTTTNSWRNVPNWNQGSVWIKGGAYKRPYKLTLTMWDDGTHTTATQYTTTLTTPASTYPTAISIPSGATADQIAKITAEYNAAANQYLGDAAGKIQPEQIAADLAAAITGTGPGQIPSTDIFVSGATIIINTPLLYQVEIDDGGDGTLAVATSRVVQNINQLTDKAWFGHIVKVAPKKSDEKDAYYLKATGKNGEADGSGYGYVVWKECAGEEFDLSEGVFAYASLGPYGPSGTEALVFSKSMETLNTNLGTDFPVFAPSASGDGLTNPVPYFLRSGGRGVTYLGMFQDRLVVGCGSILNFSRTGDYLNFFRQSVLTLEDTDPIEMTANDTGEDVMMSSVLFDRSLYIMGMKRQYSVNGRQALTPTSQNISVVGNFDNRSAVRALSTDNNIFLWKSKYPGDSEQWTSAMYQLQYGQVADVTEAYSVSQQLDTYLSQQVVDLTYISKPNMILARAADGYTTYNYRFIDAQGGGERLQSAWDKYLFAVGFVGQAGTVGMTHRGTTVCTVIQTKCSDTGLWYECFCTLDATTRDQLNIIGNVDLDLAQLYIPGQTSIYTLNPTWAAGMNALILVMTGPYAGTLIPFADHARVDPGGDLAGENYTVGCPYTALVQPTMPFPKNYDGSVSTHGRYVINKMQLTVDNTPGMVVQCSNAYQSWTALNFSGHMLFSNDTALGWNAYKGRLPFQCDFETREGGVVIYSKVGTPFRISAINYDAQNFPR